MKNYLQLEKLVESGRLKLYFILSIPRTRSTAIQISFTQAPEVDGQLDEPMHNFDYPKFHSFRFDAKLTPGKDVRNFEEACGKILQRANQLFDDTNKLSISLVIHDQFNTILQDELSYLLKLTSNVIIVIRDPRLQFLSILTRMVHERLIKRFSNKLSAREILKLIDLIENMQIDKLILATKGSISKKTILETIGKQKDSTLEANDILQAYKITINQVKYKGEIFWANLDYYLERIRSYKKEININAVLLDCEMLVQNPVEMLQLLIKNINGITFTDKMIHGWEKGVGDNFYCCWPSTFSKNENITFNAWKDPARNSTGFSTQTDSANFIPNIEDFPLLLRPIINQAMLQYKKYISMPELVKPEKKMN